MNKNMMAVSLFMTFLGVRLLLIGYYPYTRSEMLATWGQQQFFLLLTLGIVILILLHEVMHFSVAKLYGSKPSFGFAWVWKMPCPCVRFDGDSLASSQMVAIIMIPQILTVGFFAISLISTQSPWGYLFFSLGFAHLYGSVLDFTETLDYSVRLMASKRSG